MSGSRKGKRKRGKYSSKHEEKKMKKDLWVERMGGKFKKQTRGGLKLKDVGVNKADAMQDAKKLKEKGYITHIEKGLGTKAYGIYSRKRK